MVHPDRARYTPQQLEKEFGPDHPDRLFLDSILIQLQNLQKKLTSPDLTQTNNLEDLQSCLASIISSFKANFLYWLGQELMTEQLIKEAQYNSESSISIEKKINYYRLQHKWEAQATVLTYSAGLLLALLLLSKNTPIKEVSWMIIGVLTVGTVIYLQTQRYKEKSSHYRGDLEILKTMKLYLYKPERTNWVTHSAQSLKTLHSFLAITVQEELRSNTDPDVAQDLLQSLEELTATIVELDKRSSSN